MDRNGTGPASGDWTRPAGTLEPRPGVAPGTRQARPLARAADGSGPGWQPGSPATLITRPRPARPAPPGRLAPLPRIRRLASQPAARQALLLLGYLAAGVAVTWPRATYLAGRLPALRDASGYVWDFWWMARQAIHLGNPWYTNHLAAPLGSWLGYHTLMPLPGLLMTPFTLTFGPSASYNLLSVACPGLLSYAMYRTARLWLPSTTGTVAAGAFFGLSTILCWRSWYQLNLAAGALFLPLALAAAVRLRRSPGWRQAGILGLVLTGALLTDQESAVMAGLLTALTLLTWIGLPWVPRPAAAAARWLQPAQPAGGPAVPPGWRPWLRRLALAGIAPAITVVLGSPQLAAMAMQGPGGPAGSAAQAPVVAADYVGSGAGLLQLFAPSPRLAGYGLGPLTYLYAHGGPVELVMVGYGSVLTVLALVGLAVVWRRRSARLLALLWAGCTVVALGTAPWIVGRRWLLLPEIWHGVRVSALMPFSWLVQLPLLADFREADRFTELGLVGAALLAGAGISWLSARSRRLLVVAVVLALLEAGWQGNSTRPIRIGVMATAMPALDRPIAADRSGSVVVDVPFGIRGGLPVLGGAFPPVTMTLATADGHPRAGAFISRIPAEVRAQIGTIPFYKGLLQAQGGPLASAPVSARVAGLSARRLHIGWVVNWERSNAVVTTYLRETGFRQSYQADGAAVYRPIPGWPQAGFWSPVRYWQAHDLAPVAHQRRWFRYHYPAGSRARGHWGPQRV